MTASRKIAEAENILRKIQSSDSRSDTELEDFISNIHGIFLHLLDEYNLKFGLKIERITLEKFKSKAKKAGNIQAINFLIWYEKEYRRIRNADYGHILEKNSDHNQPDVLESCTVLLDKIRNMTYLAYQNF